MESCLTSHVVTSRLSSARIARDIISSPSSVEDTRNFSLKNIYCFIRVFYMLWCVLLNIVLSLHVGRWCAFIRFWHGMGHRFPERFFLVFCFISGFALPVTSSFKLFIFVINTCTYTVGSHTINPRLPLCVPRASQQIYICLLFERIEKTYCICGTSSRKYMIEIIADVLRKPRSHLVLPVGYLYTV